MGEVAYNIFGRPVKVRSSVGDRSRVLFSELDLYPRVLESGKGRHDISLDIVEKLDFRGLNNPAGHIETDRGFIARYSAADIEYSFDGPSLAEIRVAIRQDASRSVRWLKKIKNIQYAAPYESAGQIVHELALIPSACFDPSRAVFHSSAIAGVNGEVTMIGGTGGIGKTSLALELCGAGATFLADDMAVVSKEGWVSPNLAYPKVYKYNVSDPDLYARVFKDASRINRWQWSARGLLGSDKVRRRVSPATLYDNYSELGGSLARYVILIKDSSVDRIQFSAVSPETAARMSLSVIASELSRLLMHINWHEFNSVAMGRPPAVLTHSLLQAWQRNMQLALSGCESVVCRLPSTASVKQLKKEVGDWLRLDLTPPTSA